MERSFWDQGFVKRVGWLRRQRRRLFYLMVRSLASGVSILPRSFAAAGVGGLGRLAWVLCRAERDVARRQLAVAFPEWSDERRESVARACFVRFGDNLVDSLRAERQVVIEAEDEARLRSIVRQAKPVLFLTLHLGAWERLGQYLASEAPGLAVVTANPHNPRVDRWLRERREARGMVTFDRYRGGAAAARWLLRGRPLAVLADLRSNVPSVDAPWFGREAPTIIGPARLARRANAVVLPVGMVRAGDRLRVLVGEPLEFESRANDRDQTDRNEFDRQAAAASNRALEQLIRTAPEEWMWFHNRYGSRLWQ